MSPATSARAQATRAAAPARRPGSGGRAALSVLDRKALLERARRRRARLLLVVSGLVLTGALGMVAAAQGVVTTQQLHLDRLDQQLAQAVAKTQTLEVTRARLDAPSRVLAVAEHRLHMATPPSITYLSPAAPVAVARHGRGSGG